MVSLPPQALFDYWQRASHRNANPLLPEGMRAPDGRAVSLVREILMDAWTIGRTMPRALHFIFGIASPVAAIIIQMVYEIDRIVVAEARQLKARWPVSRGFWRKLLQVATGTEDQALANVHLHCLQLLGSEVVQTLN